MSTTIERTVKVPLSQKEAFLLLIEGTSVATWFGADRANVEPKAGGAYEVYWQADKEVDSTAGCDIISLEQDARLVVEWRGPSASESFAVMKKPGSTRVAFVLKRTDAGTHIGIRHGGFDEGSEWDDAKRYYEKRWDIWAHNLQLLGEVAAKLEASRTTLGYAPAPGAGLRRRFDFTKITLSAEKLFNQDINFANVADQA